MALPLVRCTLLFVSLPVLAAKPASASECVGETCADDDDEVDDEVTMVQLAFRKPERRAVLLTQVDEEEEEISNLLQNSVQASAQKEDTDPEPLLVTHAPESAEENEVDFFIGDWHDDHGNIATFTRDNASWYHLQKGEGGVVRRHSVFRVNSTHMEMDVNDLVWQGEIQEGHHHMHWHRGFMHEEWQKVGFEEEDTRWMHGSHYDHDHPIADYDVTPEDLMHETREEFIAMEEAGESVADLVEHDIDEHIADGTMPELQPMPEILPESNDSYMPEVDEHLDIHEPEPIVLDHPFVHIPGPPLPGNGTAMHHIPHANSTASHDGEVDVEAPSTPLSPEGDAASSHLFSQDFEDEEFEDDEPLLPPLVPFAETEPVQKLLEAFTHWSEIAGEEDVNKGYDLIAEALERHAERIEQPDTGRRLVQIDGPSRVVRALEVLSKKFGRVNAGKMATAMAVVMLKKVDEAVLLKKIEEAKATEAEEAQAEQEAAMEEFHNHRELSEVESDEPAV